MLKDCYDTAVTILKHPYKFPRSIFILYLFVAVFQELAIRITSILTIRLKLLLPDSWLLFCQKLQLSFDEFWIIWSGLLWLFVIILLLESISAVLLGEKDANAPIEPLRAASATFLCINTCILFLLLIYLKLTRKPLISFFFQPYPYSQNLIILPLLFLCYFSIRAYFVEFYSLFSYIIHAKRYSLVIRGAGFLLLLTLIFFFLLK